MGSNQVWHNLPLPSKTNPFNCPFFIFYHHCRCAGCIYFFKYFHLVYMTFFLMLLSNRPSLHHQNIHTYRQYIHTFYCYYTFFTKKIVCATAYLLCFILYSLWVVSKQHHEKGLQNLKRERERKRDAKCSQTLKKSKYTYFTR